MPAAALVAVSLVLAVLAGLAIGAVWGLSGGSSPSATPSSTTTPGGGSTSASPSSGSSTPAGSTSAEPTPTESSSQPVAPGTAPPAPATTTTSADGWRLGSWRITNTGGAIGVDTTARNTSTGTRSADLILYIYVGGEHIATTTARVTDVPAGETVPVQFTSTDAWKPGQKVLLLQVG
jgi:hypothetical protein